MESKDKAMTFIDWVISNFDVETLSNIAAHGCAAGCSRLAHYHETTALYSKYKNEIWRYINEEAHSLGYSNTLAFIASLDGADLVEDDVTQANLLVWYATKRVAIRFEEEY